MKGESGFSLAIASQPMYSTDRQLLQSDVSHVYAMMKNLEVQQIPVFSAKFLNYYCEHSPVM